MRFQKFLGSLPVRYQWTVHNLLGHPVSEILHLLGLGSASGRVHDGTMPLLPDSPGL